MCVFVCVRACVRACVRGCGCGGVRMCDVSVRINNKLILCTYTKFATTFQYILYHQINWEI